MRGMLLVIGLLAAGPVRAQTGPVLVAGVRNLTFGILLPGVPRTVPRTDPVSSGQFDLTGPANKPFVMLFTLPGVLVGPAAATIPLSFAASDAGYSQSQSIGSQVAFDPRRLFFARLSGAGRGSVFIGGTASPALGQRAGGYTATMTLTVFFLP